MKILCKMFGHWWKYYFSMSDSQSKRQDVRVCECCGDVQIYKQIIQLPFREDKDYVWMNMIGFTKLGAEKHHGKDLK